MSGMPVEVSVVVPAYRSGRVLAGTVPALHAALAGRGEPAEILVVDDGSGDGTEARARAAAGGLGLREEEGDVRFRSLALPTNRGKGHAVRAGMAAARGQWCVFTDADLPYGTEGVLAVLDALRGGSPVAVASRAAPGSSLSVPSRQRMAHRCRHAAGRLLNLSARLALGLRAKDTQAGLKGFSRPVVEALFPAVHTDRFGFDVELFAVLARAGIRPEEVPVHHRFGDGGSSVRLLRDGTAALRDLLAVRWRLWTGGYREAVARLRGIAADGPGTVTRDGSAPAHDGCDQVEDDR